MFDEEAAEVTKLYGDVDPVDFPEMHRFHVPEGCHWRDVRGGLIHPPLEDLHWQSLGAALAEGAGGDGRAVL